MMFLIGLMNNFIEFGKIYYKLITLFIELINEVQLGRIQVFILKSI